MGLCIRDRSAYREFRYADAFVDADNHCERVVPSQKECRGVGCSVSRWAVCKLYLLTIREADLNLPVTGVSLVLVSLFLRVRTPEGSAWSKLKRVDWV